MEDAAAEITATFNAGDGGYYGAVSIGDGPARFKCGPHLSPEQSFQQVASFLRSLATAPPAAVEMIDELAWGLPIFRGRRWPARVKLILGPHTRLLIAGRTHVEVRR